MSYCGNCGVPLLNSPSDCRLCGHQTVVRAPIKRPYMPIPFHPRFDKDACLMCGEYHGDRMCPHMEPKS